MDTELFTDWARGFADGASGEPMRERDVTYCEGYEAGVIGSVLSLGPLPAPPSQGALYVLGYAHGFMAEDDVEYVRQRDRSDDAEYRQGVQNGYAARQQNG